MRKGSFFSTAHITQIISDRFLCFTGADTAGMAAFGSVLSMVDLGIVGHGLEDAVKAAENRKMALARQLGEAGEEAVGITGPKTAIEIAESGKIRIPDRLTDTTLTEVKNVGSLSYSQQLRDFTTYSQANGLTFELWVRPST